MPKSPNPNLQLKANLQPNPNLNLKANLHPNPNPRIIHILSALFDCIYVVNVFPLAHGFYCNDIKCHVVTLF